MPRDPHDDSNIYPEREESNGKADKGPDPDTQDNKTSSDNGKAGH